VADGDGRHGSVDGRAARWAGQRDKRRAEIVEAALVAIAEHGPWVSTEQIAERAGIRRPQLYRHFADADDLHGTIARRIAGLLVTEAASALRRPSGSPNAIVSRVVRTFVVWLTDNVALYQYVVLRSLDGGPAGDQLIMDVRTVIGEGLRDIFVAYLALFGADPAPADPLAFGLVGLVESSATRWAVAPGTLDRDQLIAQMADWCWSAIDSALRAAGVVLDPETQLPHLPD
jgi:AcrR family transcriptional regulator